MNDKLGDNLVIEIKSIGKKYPFKKQAVKDFWALKGASLDVCKGDVVGILGRNGAGKTTLLNIIAGILPPTEGSFSVKGRVLGLLNLGIGFHDSLTGRENIFLNGTLLGASRKELSEKLLSIIDFSELGSFIDMPLGTYSQGMRLRLGFSIIANLDFDILVIDEILAVGDALFQNKCFEQINNFRRSGRTLVLTSQSMDLIERLCSKVVVLDHGKILFYGNPPEAINRYRALLNRDRFFVQLEPEDRDAILIRDTKKWANDISHWGKKMGAKEIVIDSVKLIDKLGRRYNRIKTKDPLEIKVGFIAKEPVKDVHFGIAIFRNDGVYCYGPNTAFDKRPIPEIGRGKGFFSLRYDNLLLAPGKYRISVAIWDKNETVAFDYHNGCYDLIVEGSKNPQSELLSIPFKIKNGSLFSKLFCLKQKTTQVPDINTLADKWGEKKDDEGLRVESVKLFNYRNIEKDTFLTNESAKISIKIKNTNLRKDDENLLLWVGIHRKDGIYCQGVNTSYTSKGSINILFPKLSLLPGGYTVSIGVWDMTQQRFLLYRHGVYSLQVVFNQEDHGTVYLSHKWKWNFKRR